MADITIRFRFNIETGRKEIVVEYESDRDALPHEHERRHREIVLALVGRGVIGAAEASSVRVERVRPRRVERAGRAAGEADRDAEADASGEASSS